MLVTLVGSETDVDRKSENAEFVWAWKCADSKKNVQ